MMNVLILLLIIFGVASQAAFITVEHKKQWTAAVLLKGLASLFFVALGIVCSLKTGFNDYDKLIIAGLILGLLGDVFLNLRHVFKSLGDKIFLIGVAAFLFGHIVYLVAVAPKAGH